jgi:hypothetical protein
MRRIVLRVAIVCSLLSISGTSFADDIGDVGPLAGLEVFTTSADGYLINHGRALVKNSLGALDEYHWGGVACGTRLLSEAQVGALQAALNTKNMFLRPAYQPGQGDARCLVGFLLVPKTQLKLVQP